MIELLFISSDRVESIELDELDAHLQRDSGVLWIDIHAPSEDDLDLMRDRFRFHPLAIEDVHNQQQRPKVEEFTDHLFMILNPVTFKNGELVSRELDAFIGNRYIVTVHQDDEPLITTIRQRIDPQRLPFAISSTYLLYLILDTVVDSYLPILETIENQIDALGAQLLQSPTKVIQSQLFQFKQNLNVLWWVVYPKRNIISALTGHDLVFIEQKSQFYLRDIGDHLLRITDMIQISRDSVNGLINLYASAVSNQLNATVNRITTITIIVGALAVISGFYGMNFEQTWPPFDAVWGLPVVLAIMIVVVIIMVLLVPFLRK